MKNYIFRVDNANKTGYLLVTSCLIQTDIAHLMTTRTTTVKKKKKEDDTDSGMLEKRKIPWIGLKNGNVGIEK